MKNKGVENPRNPKRNFDYIFVDMDLLWLSVDQLLSDVVVIGAIKVRFKEDTEVLKHVSVAVLRYVFHPPYRIAWLALLQSNVLHYIKTPW